jgi:hypothetical protein
MQKYARLFAEHGKISATRSRIADTARDKTRKKKVPRPKDSRSQSPIYDKIKKKGPKSGSEGGKGWDGRYEEARGIQARLKLNQ